ncbi:MAG TPA: adenylate/guanylate cyclase domain-containing protein [Gaiellaceae bacterium]|nr:adenylate/guanylate cyclase domain-containing protein [Gaiellaceae bacterium]
MRSDLPSGTVTFLFTDVEGSTRLLHELGAEGYAEALAEHRRLIREACARVGGVEVDTQGDAFLFAFPTAPGAMVAALAMTDVLAAGPIQVRVGLHTGRPHLTAEGYVGDDVHFAARVAATGHGGQVVVSEATAKLVELELVDLGEHRLKDIAQAVPLFQLGEGSFPPLKTISNTNLPRPASSFLGREAELAAVLSKIEAGARLVTLTGPGGTGKTRLALEAAASLVPSYKAGVFWVGLASLRDPALVTETIAQTLGAKDGLASHISERELLLLLDNLEQVVACAPELSALLSSCSNLTLLVTSRELLRVRGEVEYPVPPLAEPEAVELFCARAQLEPSDDIAELCARLDSLPLAVELAAARCKALSPAQILARLPGRLDLLQGGRDADPRQHTLRATIEWSYDLLSLEEQRLFARLTVFAGGCTLEAAEEVCEADLDTLQSLVEKSLLRYSNERYWMLETIREYAGERLSETGDVAEIRRRHSDFVRRLIARAEPELDGERQRMWFETLEHEQNNVREALVHLDDSGDGVGQLDVVVGLQTFWYLRGNWVEGRRWTERAIAHSSGLRSVRRATAFNAAAAYAEKLGDTRATRRHGEQALAMSRELGDSREMAAALMALSSASRWEGDYEAAVALLGEAVDAARDARDRHLLAEALGGLAFMAMEQQDYRRALSSAEEVTALFRELGDDAGAAWARGIAVNCLVCTGREQEALDAAREVLRLACDTGFVAVLAGMFGLVAAALGRRGNPSVGATLLGAEAALRERVHLDRSGAYKQLHPAIVDEVHRSLGADLYDEAFAIGRRMSMEDAVEYALASID